MMFGRLIGFVWGCHMLKIHQVERLIVPGLPGFADREIASCPTQRVT